MEKKQFFNGGGSGSGSGFSNSQLQFQGGYAYAYNHGLQISEAVNYSDKQMPQLVEMIDLEVCSDKQMPQLVEIIDLEFQAKDSELQCQQTQNWHMEGATTPLVDIEQVQAYQQAKRPHLGVNDLASPISDWQQVQAHQQAKRPCLAVEDSSTSLSVTNFSVQSNHIINNQGSEYPMMAIHNQENVNYPYAPMRDQIQGPHSIPTTTPGMINYPYAPMRDQIQGPHSIPKTTTTEMINYPYAPMRDQIQGSHSINTITQVDPDTDEEDQIIDQNEYLTRIKSLTNLLDLEKEQNPGNNTQTQDNITVNQLSSEPQLAHKPVIRVNSFTSLISLGPGSKC
uniref:Uncharacterized protein n=1 Tax=Quercus lobata TaxID=97700 RepID=A0A7N2M5B5_QUELO